MEATILTPVSCLGPITTCLKDRYVGVVCACMIYGSTSVSFFRTVWTDISNTCDAMQNETIARRGVQEDVKYIDDKSVVLTYRMPWQEVVTDLHDVVRSWLLYTDTYIWRPSVPRFTLVAPASNPPTNPQNPKTPKPKSQTGQERVGWLREPQLPRGGLRHGRLGEGGAGVER